MKWRAEHAPWSFFLYICKTLPQILLAGALATQTSLAITLTLDDVKKRKLPT